MSIPLNSCTISVLRSLPPLPGDEEAYGVTGVRQVIASGVRAVIGPERGQEASAGASQSTVLFRLNSDPVVGGIKHDDWVMDEQSEIVYAVIWTMSRVGLGLDHINGRLSLVTGITGRKAAIQGSRS